MWYVASVGGSGSYDYPNGLCGMTERSGVVTHNQKCNLPGWQGGCCTLISMTTDMSPTGKLSTCRPFAILAQGRVVLDFENSMANRLVQWSAALPDVWHGDASVTLAQWLARLLLAVAAISFAAGAGVGWCTAGCCLRRAPPSRARALHVPAARTGAADPTTAAGSWLRTLGAPPTAHWRALGHVPEDLVNGVLAAWQPVTPLSRPVRSSVPRLG